MTSDCYRREKKGSLKESSCKRQIPHLALDFLTTVEKHFEKAFTEVKSPNEVSKKGARAGCSLRFTLFKAMFFQSYALEGRNPPVPRDLSVPLSLTRSGLPSGVVLRPATSSIAFEARKRLRFWPASGNTSKGYFQVRGYTIMQKRSLPPQVSCLFPFPSLGLGYRGSSLQLTVR